MKTSAAGRGYARDLFFKRVRSAFGNLDQPQVDGFNLLLAEAERRQTSPNQFAYILATAWHETAHTIHPIEEIGHGVGKAYGPSGFYGRGYVQLTWEVNYSRATRELRAQGVLTGVEDLVAVPALALRPDVALAILFVGMAEGWFTGKKLSDYIGETKLDWVGARRIVNGLDRAQTIAGYAQAFLGALVLTELPDAAPIASRPTPSAASPIVDKALNPPAQPPRGPSPAPAGASAATKESTMSTAATADIQAKIPGVDFFQGAIDTVEGFIGSLTTGLVAAEDPKNPHVTATPGGPGKFIGTASNIRAAITKLGELASDARKKDVVEGIADGVDLLTLSFATLDTWDVKLPIVTSLFKSGLNLHVGGVNQPA